jgi:hypothetical protein
MMMCCVHQHPLQGITSPGKERLMMGETLELLSTILKLFVLEHSLIKGFCT